MGLGKTVLGTGGPLRRQRAIPRDCSELAGKLGLTGAAPRRSQTVMAIVEAVVKQTNMQARPAGSECSRGVQAPGSRAA